MVAQGKIKVLLGKVGLDTHDREVKILTMALRDAGMEVIYTGIAQTPEQIVETAVQEDVDVIGLSFLIGEYLYYTRKVVELLAEKKVKDIPVLVGGIIPKGDIPKLKELGVKEVFRADSSLEDIISCIRSIYRGQKQEHSME